MHVQENKDSWYNHFSSKYEKQSLLSSREQAEGVRRKVTVDPCSPMWREISRMLWFQSEASRKQHWAGKVRILVTFGNETFWGKSCDLKNM